MPAAVERTGVRRVAAVDAGDASMAAQGRDAARADGIALLESEVRELVRRRGVDPMAEPDRFADLVREAAADYAARAARGLLLGLPDMDRVVREVSDAVGGFGALQPYLDDPEIEEVWLNAPSRTANPLSPQDVAMALSRCWSYSDGRNEK